MKFVLMLVVVLLSACSDGYKEQSYPVLPQDLKDCKFYRLENSGGSVIHVVRCPNSQVSASATQGKVKRTVVVIDGKEYVEK